jgi:hypothetical protein
MEITINLDTLTPEQAFNLGFLLKERPPIEKTNPVNEIEQQRAKKPRATRKGSMRFKYNTSAPFEVIKLATHLRKNGLTLQQVADELNKRNVPSISGKEWSEQMAWSVMFSKQAWPLWEVA